MFDCHKQLDGSIEYTDDLMDYIGIINVLMDAGAEVDALRSFMQRLMQSSITKEEKLRYLRSQRHDLSLPVKLLGNEYALHYVIDYIDRAERLGRALYKSLQQKEIPDESRVQAKQHFYAECEQLLWRELDALTQPNVDYIARAEQVREAQIQAALSCADWMLGQLNLRGRAMVQVMGSQEKILQKEIVAIRKRGDKS